MTGSAPPKDDVTNVAGANGGNAAIEESEEARIERLGRMRPEKFNSFWEEAGFCFSVVMSQALTVSISVHNALRPMLIMS